MAKDTGIYRPVITRKEAQALLTVLQVGMTHTNLTREDYAFVLRFMNKISQQEQMAQILDKLGKELPDLIEGEVESPSLINELTDEELKTKFADWTNEMLEHFLIAKPDAPETQWVQAEIERRRRNNTE